MSESTADIQHSRALKSLLGKGLAATATGALFLAAPHFLASQLRPFGAIESLTSGIQVCGLILLLIGLVALGAHFSVRTRMSKESTLDPAVDGVTVSDGWQPLHQTRSPASGIAPPMAFDKV